MGNISFPLFITLIELSTKLFHKYKFADTMSPNIILHSKIRKNVTGELFLTIIIISNIL